MELEANDISPHIWPLKGVVYPKKSGPSLQVVVTYGIASIYVVFLVSNEYRTTISTQTFKTLFGDDVEIPRRATVDLNGVAMKVDIGQDDDPDIGGLDILNIDFFWNHEYYLSMDGSISERFISV